MSAVYNQLGVNSKKRWKLLNKKPIFESKWLSVYSHDYQLPDGKIRKDYYHLSRPDYVLVIAVDEQKRIVVQKNYRRGVDDCVYELPAGWIDEGEVPAQAAERELREETGYMGKAVILGEVYPQPAFSSMKAFVALVRISDNKKGKQDLGEDEHIEYELIDYDRLEEKIRKGTIKDMGLLSSLSLVRGRI